MVSVSISGWRSRRGEPQAAQREACATSAEAVAAEALASAARVHGEIRAERLAGRASRRTDRSPLVGGEVRAAVFSSGDQCSSTPARKSGSRAAARNDSGPMPVSARKRPSRSGPRRGTTAPQSPAFRRARARRRCPARFAAPVFAGGFMPPPFTPSGELSKRWWIAGRAGDRPWIAVSAVPHNHLSRRKYRESCGA